MSSEESSTTPGAHATTVTTVGAGVGTTNAGTKSSSGLGVVGDLGAEDTHGGGAAAAGAGAGNVGVKRGRGRPRKYLIDR